MSSRFLIKVGDSVDLLKRLPDSSIEMVLCDLPYGTTACAWDEVIPLEPLWAQYKRIIKPRGAIVLTASQPFTSALVMSNPTWFRHEWIWRKSQGTNPLTCRTQPMKNHESVLVFGEKAPTYNPQMWQGRAYTGFSSESSTTGEVYGKAASRHRANPTGTRYPLSVIDCPRERRFHPTPKPVALFEYLIRTYSDEGDIVLDNCMGSGTTAVAALKANRRFIGIERNPYYVRIAQERISAWKVPSWPAENHESAGFRRALRASTGTSV